MPENYCRLQPLPSLYLRQMSFSANCEDATATWRLTHIEHRLFARLKARGELDGCLESNRGLSRLSKILIRLCSHIKIAPRNEKAGLNTDRLLLKKGLLTWDGIPLSR